MTARCPECESRRVRVHATLVELSFSPRWWFFGPMVLKPKVVAAECSCGKCLYAFTMDKDGVQAAPRQDAYDQLRAARAGVEAAAKPREKQRDTTPRPAPDPRARRR